MEKYIYEVMAYLSTAILILSLFLSMYGVEDSSGIESEGGFFSNLFSVKTIFGFFAGLGWGALAVLNKSGNSIEALLVGIVLGIVYVLVVFLIMYIFTKLSKEQNVNKETSIGQKGTVTITIPKNQSGLGKIGVTVGDSYREVEAITNEKNDISLNTPIEIISVENDIFIVKQIKG